MPLDPSLHSKSFRHALRRPAWRWIFALLPVIIMSAMVMSLVWLPWKAQKQESAERQEQLIADTLWVEQSVRLQLLHDEDALRQVASDITGGHLSPVGLRARAVRLFENRPEMTRLTWLDANFRVLASTDDASQVGTQLSDQTQAAASTARSTGKARYGIATDQSGRSTLMQMDYYLPLMDGERYLGSLVASYSTAAILEQMVPWWFAQDNEITLSGAEDNVIERRAAGGRGRGVYTHSHILDLPGINLTLRTNSLKTAPKLLPNLLVGSIIALSLALLGSLLALGRDVRRRLDVENALCQQVAFRTAMENSLVTGLRARDLVGRVTYVNPAFCQMVGTLAEDLVGRVPPMPYWAPEAMAEYQKRFAKVLAGTITPQGFETIFQRACGERFPVLIFESPLVNEHGIQTGWMGSILDITERKQIEDLNRKQQEKLESSARLASMGEIASTLAHELNQPLAAISSYTTGALNLLTNSMQDQNYSSETLNSKAGKAATLDMHAMRLALERANLQAQRAGQIVRSVHTFVKQRESTREPVSVESMIESIVPLVELQAHKFFVSVRTDLVPNLPPVLADRVLIEQVLLNLTRNAVESMQQVAPELRILLLRARLEDPLSSLTGPQHTGDDLIHRLDLQDAATGFIKIAVIDRGHGIAQEMTDRLFSPFFSTKAEGMGMGLNICRTAVEFHGGRLAHQVNPAGGTIFEFSLPIAGVMNSETNTEMNTEMMVELRRSSDAAYRR